MQVEVLGDGPGAGVHALAAEDAGLARVARDGRLVVVAPSAPDRLAAARAAIDRGAVVLLDPPVAAGELAALADADEGRGLLRLGAHAAHAPGLRTAAAAGPDGPAAHVSVVVTRPPTDGEGDDPVAVLGPGALSAAEALARDTVVAVRAVDRDGRATSLELVLAHGGSGTLQLTLGDAAVWQAQSAWADGVVTVELSPAVLVERDGEPVPVDGGRQSRDARLVDLGYLDQLGSMAAGSPARLDDDLRRLRLLDGARPA